MRSRLAEILLEQGGANGALTVHQHVALAPYTRFAIGGPAHVLMDAANEKALAEGLAAIQESSEPHTVIGGGTNLVVSDAGFPGVVLRYTKPEIKIDGTLVQVAAGAVLQNLVDATVARGLRGLETMTGIPGWVGGAVYGNAGAYGHSLHERIESVRFFDGTKICEITNAECEFRYRESVFKRRKDWIVVSALLRLDPADPAEVAATASGILQIRNEKYPPTMHCAGSIFKNLLWDELPEAVRTQIPSRVVREGKVPSAYFLEQAGAKGLVRGGVRVADYHANLIYNQGGGTSREVRELISELKSRVQHQFGIHLEEEVQYI